MVIVGMISFRSVCIPFVLVPSRYLAIIFKAVACVFLGSCENLAT